MTVFENLLENLLMMDSSHVDAKRRYYERFL